MTKRIFDKINELSKSLYELGLIFPNNIETYSNIKTKAACERYIEKIIESVIDLSYMLIKSNKLIGLTGDINSFDILSQLGIISFTLCTKLKEAKGMRNRIVHNYDNVNDELVFDSIKEHLFDDINNFLAQVDSFLKK